MALETVSMMDDCAELSDELHTMHQEWQALVRELTAFITVLRDPQYGRVSWRSDIAQHLEDIMKGE